MIHSFLLIGQSNMAGRGEISEAVPVDTTHIKILRNGRWQPMFRPINPDRAFSGVNLAESFAEAYAKQFNVDVGLICCADGGTSLDQWKEGSLLYDNAIYQTRLAVRTSALAGVLWHQGEGDCCEDLARSYKERFEKILCALKRDLNITDIPILLGGLGDYFKDNERWPTQRSYYIVNEQLQQVAEENKMVGYVSADGLLPKDDGLHFNAKSLYEFGLRYFNEYLKQYDKNKIFENHTEEVRSEMEAL